MTSMDKPELEENVFLDYKAVARLLGVPIGTVHGLVSQKRIPHVRLGPGFVRFDSVEIARWLDARKVEPKEATRVHKRHGVHR
jgi:excisionase family DNA binding protein